jgi:hypothetical protein
VYLDTEGIARDFSEEELELMFEHKVFEDTDDKEEEQLMNNHETNKSVN